MSITDVSAELHTINPALSGVMAPEMTVVMISQEEGAPATSDPDIAREQSSI